MRPPVWLGTLRQWHWISSALCLAGMLLFAVTGITLNHASQISAKPLIVTLDSVLPKPLLAELQLAATQQQIPRLAQDWIEQQLQQSINPTHAEWSSDELYLALPRPGGDGWFSIDLDSGELLYESTDRGWIAYFNDLHKGRHSGAAWSWFIDIFAGICVLFSFTGLWLLTRQTNMRPNTWPVTLAGLVIPLLIMLLFIH
ncbi:PepSY-associated TM helix domain-containing protein [Denitrificimonas caeni]|uniref:PepSY-associated TM helix domain-containing protein n=1 Tax=Denitrificimonas caeni TaxID=521720 RepID=UPI00196273CD|nr:PepSY-associated TM helix domain-containing protein [Denitrificimonas caeni]